MVDRYNSGTSYDRDQYFRDRERRRGRDRELDWNHPCETILIKALPEYISESDLYDKFGEDKLSPIDVRMVRRKGARAAFAFVEFAKTSEATGWMNKHQGFMKIDRDNISPCVYSQKSAPSSKPVISSDWTCPNPNCGFVNFARRDVCYRCNTANTSQFGQTSTEDGSSQLGQNPCNTILVRGLDGLSDENSILTALAKITSLSPKNCYVMRDLTTGASSGYGFLEFSSVMDGKRIKDHFTQQPFEVDGKLILVDYAKNTYTTILASLQYAQTQQMTVAQPRQTEYELQALAASASANTTATSHYQHSSQSSTSTSSNNAAADTKTTTTASTVVPGQEYPDPDPSQYQYEATSGYYYDSTTGLYYDSTTQYFYNSTTQQYMYWDGTNKTYVPVDRSAESSQNSANQHAPHQQQPTSQEKKGAKDIAKEMARWAKQQNKKSKPAASITPQTTLPPASKASNEEPGLPADMAYDVLMGNKKLANRDDNQFMPPPPSNVRPTSGLVASYDGGDSEEEDEPLDPSRHIDKQKLTCLLCERKFNSTAILEKHVAMSDLHKENLAKLLTKSKGMLTKQYRDRAKERRVKNGAVGGPAGRLMGR